MLFTFSVMAYAFFNVRVGLSLLKLLLIKNVIIYIPGKMLPCFKSTLKRNSCSKVHM